ncbi:hypothetical protein CBOM_07931 [Ceraceosorus bombacis]|uniref:Uncharacterized protein n=1 Tax=Ceraceosorus bombacis TaxID=401625 RepID=A0A0P1BRT6_9BASI|nr:hypothetical protein CBOM_07931 [Ceraceosorus bombacis]
MLRTGPTSRHRLEQEDWDCPSGDAVQTLPVRLLELERKAPLIRGRNLMGYSSVSSCVVLAAVCTGHLQVADCKMMVGFQNTFILKRRLHDASCCRRTPLHARCFMIQDGVEQLGSQSRGTAQLCRDAVARCVHENFSSQLCARSDTPSCTVTSLERPVPSALDL